MEYGDKYKYICDKCKRTGYFKTQEDGRACGSGCNGEMVEL